MISSAIDLIMGLSLQQLGLAVVGVGVSAWFAFTKAIAAIRSLLMRYALKKIAAIGIIGTIGTEMIPGLDLLAPLLGLVSGLLPF